MFPLNQPHAPPPQDARSRRPPSKRTGHICFTYEKYMFVWGGYRETSSGTTYFGGDNLWRYDCEIENWSKLKILSGNVPPGMTGSTAVVIGSNMYLFGGYKLTEGCTNTLYKLNLLSMTWELLNPTGIMPLPVDKMVAWTHNYKLYVFGGFADVKDGRMGSPSMAGFQFVFHEVEFMDWRGWTNQLFEYDPVTNNWSIPKTTGPCPIARAAHCAAIVGDHAYIFGGRHDKNRLNDLHCLDMNTLKWSGEIAVEDPKPEGRSWCSLTAMQDGRLLLYGGLSQNHQPIGDSWIFNTTQRTWRCLPFDKPRLWHTTCLSIHNEILIYGGCISDITNHSFVPKHAKGLLTLLVAPKSLKRLCLDRIVTFPVLTYTSSFCYLPLQLQEALSCKRRNVPLIPVISSSEGEES